MQTAIETVIAQFGYLGICLLIMLENVFPPIPSEIVLTFGGFVTHHTSLVVPGVVLAATVGSVVGAIILYWVGRILSAERIERLVAGRTGRVLHLTVADVRKVERWFTRHGNMAVFWGRFVPIIRSLISIPAGTTKMPFARFVVLSTIGTSIWNVVLVVLGRAAGSAWQRVAAYVDTYALVVLVVVLVTVVVLSAWFYKKTCGERC
ncbi:DedA family protein [Lacticaseibacillus thailandensis]|uniref:DedA family protein n=1 Tax=Lacticaseibacillus thailandensis TaxID=381741 RepID=UPI0006D15FAF|nr:DedA family protein [Lacticaseibacillus thailandensis]